MNKIFNSRNLIAASGFILIIIFIFVQIIGSENIGENDIIINDKGENGYFIFYNLLKNLNYKTSIWHFIRKPRDNTCFIILDYNYDKQSSLNSILEYLETGNILFIIGIRSEKEPVFNSEIEFTPSLDNKIIISDKYNDDISEIYAKITKSILTSDTDEVILSTADSNVFIKKPYKEGYVYILPDEVLFTNSGLYDPDMAVFVNNIFKQFYDHEIIFFDKEASILKEINPIIVLFKGRLFYITMQLVIIFIFFAFYKGIRFGSPIHVDTIIRRSITGHLNAVGQFYLKNHTFALIDELNISFFIFKLKDIFKIRKHVSLDELYIYLVKRLDIEKEHFIENATVKEKVTNRDLIKREKYRFNIISSLKIKER